LGEKMTNKPPVKIGVEKGINEFTKK